MQQAAELQNDMFCPAFSAKLIQMEKPVCLLYYTDGKIYKFS